MPTTADYLKTHDENAMMIAWYLTHLTPEQSIVFSRKPDENIPHVPSTEGVCASCGTLRKIKTGRKLCYPCYNRKYRKVKPC